MMQLLQGPILRYAEQLAGGSVFRKEMCSQTAMRFPVGEPPSLLGVHVDGAATGQATEPDSLTLLISVLLTPHRDQSCGATAIRSGSHREIASAANAVEGFISGGMVAEWISSLSHEAMDYVLGEPGDVFFGVWPLLHSATTVAIAEPRCAVFFRLTHVDHDAQRNVRDPFADLPALRRRYVHARRSRGSSDGPVLDASTSRT